MKEVAQDPEIRFARTTEPVCGYRFTKMDQSIPKVAQPTRNQRKKFQLRNLALRILTFAMI